MKSAGFELNFYKRDYTSVKSDGVKQLILKLGRLYASPLSVAYKSLAKRSILVDIIEELSRSK